MLVEQNISQTADNVIAVTEQFPGLFRIQMATCTSFQFRVSLFGQSVANPKPASRSASRSAVHLGDFPITMDLTAERDQ